MAKVAFGFCAVSIKNCGVVEVNGWVKGKREKVYSEEKHTVETWETFFPPTKSPVGAPQCSVEALRARPPAATPIQRQTSAGGTLFPGVEGSR
jgi:hypothetical protein